MPDSWRLSFLTPIHKKDDVNMPENYRGIAVSSNLYKLYCMILCNRLDIFIQENNLIPYNQIAFLKNTRTSDHILTLKTLIDKYVKAISKSYLFVCFVDFKSAFDSICREVLLYKMTVCNVTTNSLKQDIIQNPIYIC